MWGVLIVLEHVQTGFEVGHWGDLPDSISQAEVNCTVQLTIRGMLPLPLFPFHPPAINTLHLSADLLLPPLTFSWLSHVLAQISPWHSLWVTSLVSLYLLSILLISFTILKYLRSLHQALPYAAAPAASGIMLYPTQYYFMIRCFNSVLVRPALSHPAAAGTFFT